MASNTSAVNQLPLPLSSFIGRETELDTLHSMLAAGARLITLIGPGGVGKTRLALEMCTREASRYSGGAIFISLESLLLPDLVLSELAFKLSIGQKGDSTPLESIITALESKQILLCIDNWEHIVEASPQIVPLLAACPDIQLLATSREALRIRGERVFQVEPLRLPSTDVRLLKDNIANEAIIQLFVERAREVKPRFQLDEGNAQTVAEICALVDGLPLAVELAASMMRALSPQALLVRMKNRPTPAHRSSAVESLGRGARDLPTRQQTLKAVIGWSHKLLEPVERTVFNQLAVFAGGCDLGAAEAVCRVEDSNRRPFLDILLALVDKSLLLSKGTDDEPRFAMLQTIQEYALLKLQEERELYETHKRYALYYCDLAERAVRGLNGSGGPVWGKILEREHENFRAILSWSLNHDHIAIAHKLGGYTWRFWSERGLYTEGRGWLDKILALEGDVPSNDRANVINGAGGLATMQNDFESATKYLTQGLMLRKEVRDMPGVAASLRNLAIVAGRQVEYKIALARADESLEVAREIGDRSGVTNGLLIKSWILSLQSDFEAAYTTTLEALAIAKAIDHKSLIARALGILGELELCRNNYEQADQYVTQAREILNSLGLVAELSHYDHTQGKIALRRHRLAEAEKYLFDSLRETSRANDIYGIINALEGVACLEVARSTPDDAAQLWGACDAARQASHIPRSVYDSAFCDYYIRVAKAQLKESDYRQAYQTGKAMTLHLAVQLAMDLFAAETEKPASSATKPSFPAGLTAREVEVLRLVAQGLSDNEVAEKLVLSPRTVNAHLTSIYSKLGVNSRVAATRFAIDNGLAG